MSDTSEILLLDPAGEFGALDYGDFEGGVTAFAQIPALETLDADLDAAMAADEGEELERALAESELSPEEELAFAEFETTASPALDEVVAVLQRYPGLKLTISF
jgi:hypothetical protein